MRLTRPTRTAERECPCALRRHHPYSVLLPVGFTLPPLLPGARCALAAPFRPCPRAALRRLRGRCVFCGTVPGVAPAGGYPAPYSRGARTFLCRLRDSGRPAVWRRHKSADAASGSRPRMEVVLRRSQAAAGRHGRFAAPCRLRGLTPWDLNAGPNRRSALRGTSCGGVWRCWTLIPGRKGLETRDRQWRKRLHDHFAA